MKSIYMDHSATTPIHPSVLDAMMPCLRDSFGNPSSIHSFGQEAKKALSKAREKVAALINADPLEIIFTSGGTESDNLALTGMIGAFDSKKNHIITSSIEHHAILNTCEYLKKNGCMITYLPVDKHGLIDPDDVKKAITSKTAVISIMHANNETGTIEPIEEIGKIAEEHDICFHTDAVQTVGKIPVDVGRLNVSMLSLSGHKLYGPKGTGALYIRKGTKITPILYGGHHERDLRAGTENVPGIVGLGQACDIASKEMIPEMERISNLCKNLEQGISDNIDRVQTAGHPTLRLPHILNICFESVEGEAAVLNLDRNGIAVSSGSACTSDFAASSHVLNAMSIFPDMALGSIRFSLGKSNTQKEVDYVINSLKTIIENQRSLFRPPPVTALKKSFIVTFHEASDAIHSLQVLKKNGIKGELDSVPPEINRPSCCGVALYTDWENKEDLESFFKENDVEAEGIYTFEGKINNSEQKKKRFWPFGSR